jgi:hypothetical protein
MFSEKKTALSGYERSVLIGTLRNAKLEYETLIRDVEWFVSETPELIDTCLEILKDKNNETTE